MAQIVCVQLVFGAEWMSCRGTSKDSPLILDKLAPLLTDPLVLAPPCFKRKPLANKTFK